MSGWSFWVEPVLIHKQRIKCLAQRHNTVSPVRLELATLRSPFKHSTIESLGSSCCRPKTICSGSRWGSRIALSVQCSGQLKGMYIWDSLMSTNNNNQPSVFTLLSSRQLEVFVFSKIIQRSQQLSLFHLELVGTSHTSI